MKPTRWLKKLFAGLTWDLPAFGKEIYLTFDDGPTPRVTREVLALLRSYNVKATFFCLGSKAEKFPELLQEIRNEGHQIGNHGYSHISGFTSSIRRYAENALKGSQITNSKLFRPPYGRITPWQISQLKNTHKIILWSILSRDYNQKLTPAKCIKNVFKNAYPGAIVVFHDNEKASSNVLAALPDILYELKKQGYQFLTIPND